MLFDKRAEAIQPHLSKGDKVSIVGQLQEPSTWQSGEETRVSLTVFVDEIQFSGKQEGGNRGQPPASPPSRPPPAAPDYDEDIPF
jgi:single-stranded DNA-binding protein